MTKNEFINQIIIDAWSTYKGLSLNNIIKYVNNYCFLSPSEQKQIINQIQKDYPFIK